MSEEDLGAIARAIVDASLYMVLGTADESGRPWASPVYYAPDAYTDFYWVSSPEVRHSRNLGARRELGIVIFDSGAPIGTGQGVYMSAVAEEPTGADLDRGIAVFSRRSVEHGVREWTTADVQPPSPYRLYRARVLEHSILDRARRPDQRTRVTV